MKITIATGKTYVVIDTDSETMEITKIPQWGGGSGREKKIKATGTLPTGETFGAMQTEEQKTITEKDMKTCPHCGNKFEKKHFKQIYCGTECAKEVNRLRSSMPKKAKDEKPKKHTVKESEINQLFRKS
jgi:ribosomal protein S27AE